MRGYGLGFLKRPNFQLPLRAKQRHRSRELCGIWRSGDQIKTVHLRVKGRQLVLQRLNHYALDDADACASLHRRFHRRFGKAPHLTLAVDTAHCFRQLCSFHPAPSAVEQNVIDHIVHHTGMPIHEFLFDYSERQKTDNGNNPQTLVLACPRDVIETLQTVADRALPLDAIISESCALERITAWRFSPQAAVLWLVVQDHRVDLHSHHQGVVHHHRSETVSWPSLNLTEQARFVEQQLKAFLHWQALSDQRLAEQNVILIGSGASQLAALSKRVQWPPGLILQPLTTPPALTGSVAELAALASGEWEIPLGLALRGLENDGD